MGQEPVRHQPWTLTTGNTSRAGTLCDLAAQRGGAATGSNLPHKWVSRANARDDWIARASDEQIANGTVAVVSAADAGHVEGRRVPSDTA